jgi:hypothetical protein
MRKKFNLRLLLLVTTLVAGGLAVRKKHNAYKLQLIQSDLEAKGVHLYSRSDVDWDGVYGQLEPWNVKYRKHEGPIVLVRVCDDVEVTDELIDGLRSLPDLEQIFATSISQQGRNKLRAGMAEQVRIID